MSLDAWNGLGMMMIEAQQVIWLRALKLVAGGAGAQAESRLMIHEKFDATGEAFVSLLQGASSERVLLHVYRRRVRANLRRLSR